MNLADEVKKLAELKKAYDDAVWGFAEMSVDLQEDVLSSLKRNVLAIIKNSEKPLYFLDWDTFKEEDTYYLKHVRWFSYEDVTLEAMEKVAKENGFKTEIVDLEYDFELEEGEEAHTVKALKITWGE
jgi:hypothetical protein